MGTRLYPQNEEEVLIEKYGQRIVEDSVKFEEWLKTYPVVNEDEQGYEIYLIRKVFNYFDQIHNFRMFGYNRLNTEAVQAIEEAGSSYTFGTTTDENLIEKLKVAMNISDKVTGFNWS